MGDSDSCALSWHKTPGAAGTSKGMSAKMRHPAMLPVVARREATTKRQRPGHVQWTCSYWELVPAAPHTSKEPGSPLLEMKTHYRDFFFKFDLTSFGEERKAVHNSPVYKSSCLISVVNACGIYSVSKSLHFFQGKSNRRICVMLSMQNYISLLSQVFPWESSLP